MKEMSPWRNRERLTGTRESVRDTETEIKRKVKHEKEIEKEKYRKKSKGERKKAFRKINKKSTDDDECFYHYSWRNNVVIAFGTLSSLFAWFVLVQLMKN